MNNKPDTFERYRSFDDVPLFLDANDISRLIGVSRSNAYEIFRSEGFPALIIGGRKMVRKDKLISWLEAKEASPKESEKKRQTTSSTF